MLRKLCNRTPYLLEMPKSRFKKVAASLCTFCLHKTCVAGKEVEILKIGLESTSVYSFHPSMFLHHDKDLQHFGEKVFLLNPKQVANFKKSYSDMNKTDEIDAFVIADYLR
ncbi:IS110 family transposase, partial [Bacillus cereus]|uniref:IS110 family transposase n=2 Tax=Bacillus cereus TaxID=1396 RepID=UPI00211D5EFA